MPELSTNELALITALAGPAPVTALSPAPSSASASSTSTRTALRKCRAAWQRAYNASLRDCDEEITSFERGLASKEAANAYCAAMPLLVGHDGIRDFIACAAYGILIGAIPNDRSGQLLYAAQVALSTLQLQPKPAKLS